MIPIFKVFMSEDVGHFLSPVLHSGYIGEGEKVKLFEKKIGEVIQNDNVVAVNSGTAAITMALRLAGVGQNDFVMTSPMTCFGYKTHVLLEDGTTLPIGKIVNQKIPCRVISFNEKEQKLEPKMVTNWIKQSSKGVEWYRLHTRNGRVTRGIMGKAGIFVTGDHKILTKEGYLRVDELMPTSEIVTNQQSLNLKQKEFIVGTLLGDASLSYEGKGWGRFIVSHAINQTEWIELKEKALKGFSLNKRESPSKPGHQATITLETIKNVEWRNLRLEWYPRGKKIVPNNINLSPMTLATWYMDDGSLTAANGALLCTEGFENPSFWVLFYKLVDLGLRPHAVRRGSGYIITIGNGIDGEGSANRFFNTIAPYIPKSMRYKLPPNSPEYNPSLWDLGEAEAAIDYPVVIKIDNPPRSHKPSNVYCLEVKDNHNFVTAGMIVSNCLATNEPILSLGAVPVWVDIHSDGTMRPFDLEQKIESLWKKPKAILCMDWGGLPCDYISINYISEKFNIPIIEDACQALGSVYNDEPIGNHADFVAFSFQAIKHLTTADGGALVVNDPDLLKEARLMRWFGLDRTQGTDMRCYQDPVTWGYKFQMNDVTASIGLANIRHLPWILSETRRHANVYNDELKDLNTVRIIKPESFKKSNYWLYTLLVNDAEDFMNYLKTNGVDCSKVHDRNDTKQMFFESFEDELTGVDYFDDHHVCIPVGWWVKDSEVEQIVSLIKKYEESA